MDNSGVSEVVGSLLTITVILTAAGLIYLISSPFITGSIDSSNFENAVKNMAEIKEIVQRMKYGNEISTTKTIQLNGGSISNHKAMNLSVISNAGGTRTDREVNTLAIEVKGREVVLESGIFTREFGKVNPIPVSQPDMVVTNDTFYLSIYDFRGNLSAGGHRVTVNFRYNDTVIFNNATAFELQSDFCEVWRSSLENILSAYANPPAVLEDNDCSDKRLKVRAGNGRMILIFTILEVS